MIISPVRGVERQDSEESERRGEANSERAKEEGESLKKKKKTNKKLA